MAPQDSARIVKTPAVLGGDPRIAGRRIGVYFLREQVEGRGLAPRTVADRFDLELVAVYRALAYSHDHPEEMAEIQARRERHEHEGRDDPYVAIGPDDLGESIG